MSKPRSDSPPAAPDQDIDQGVQETPRTPEEVRRGVLRQRKHIQGLDGEDPLRGGVAD